MTNAKDQACDLCGLPVPKDGLVLKTGGRDFAFCCEGCVGIWRMLNPSAAQAPVQEEADERPFGKGREELAR